MLIRIKMGNGQSIPTVVTNTKLTDLERKRKNMLYESPEKDKPPQKKQEKKQEKKPPMKNTNQSKNKKQEKQKPLPTIDQEKKFLNELTQLQKKQPSNDAFLILQKQQQILADNQKVINHLIAQANNNNNHNTTNNNQQTTKQDSQNLKAIKQATQKSAKYVEQIKKMRDDILGLKKQYEKNDNNSKTPKKKIEIQEISEKNNNLKHLAEISKNQLEGLQNLQALKELQNFNIDGYVQSINQLKRQIIQYQKQSENIERELRQRAAKLEKLDIPQNFQTEMIKPYNNYLKDKVNNINFHTTRKNVYEKLGVFDYGQFQYDISQLMNQGKQQFGEFEIICKQYKIDPPILKLDNKQLKNLDFKIPSVLDQYKASKGINFQQKQNPETQPLNVTQQPVIKKKKQENIKKPKLINTNTIDFAHNTKYTRKDQKKQPSSVLETLEDRDKKNYKKHIKQRNEQRMNQESDFDKYLKNRAKEQLEQLYKDKKRSLEKAKMQLYQQTQQPTYIQLNLDQRKRYEKPALPPKYQQKKNLQQEKYVQPQNNKKQENNNSNTNDTTNIRQIGKEALKDKLKNLMKKQQGGSGSLFPFTQPQIQRQQRPQRAQYSENNIGNLAEGLVSLINNTLTQVNNNLSKNIQRRIQHRAPSGQRQHSKSPPRKLIVPKLEQFRPPPTFNMNLVQNSIPQQHYQAPPNKNQKIVVKDYSHLKVSNNDEDLYISDQED